MLLFGLLARWGSLSVLLSFKPYSHFKTKEAYHVTEGIPTTPPFINSEYYPIFVSGVLWLFPSVKEIESFKLEFYLSHYFVPPFSLFRMYIVQYFWNLDYSCKYCTLAFEE